VTLCAARIDPCPPVPHSLDEVDGLVQTFRG